MARTTKAVVISVSNIPNQYLTYGADNKPLKEDDNVARSWSLFMDNPSLRTRASVHIPMATAVSQAIRVAKQELKAQGITRFIVTGALLNKQILCYQPSKTIVSSNVKSCS
ncbi:PhoPQ-activated protein PqaA family protein [Symbiopectobacterium sp. Eva_TO]